MDQEISERLDRIEKTVNDNNRMLVRMRRNQRNAIFIKLLYWIVIIGLAIGAWHVIQPYLNTVTGEYNAITGKNTSATSTNSTDIMNLINQYTTSQNAAK